MRCAGRRWRSGDCWKGSGDFVMVRMNLADPPASARRNTVAVQDQAAGELFVRALWLSGLKHDAAAAYMGIPPSRLSRQIGGPYEHLSLRRMLRLPVSFWVVLAALVLQHKGLDLWQMVRALVGGRRLVSAVALVETLDRNDLAS